MIVAFAVVSEAGWGFSLSTKTATNAKLQRMLKKSLLSPLGLA
jgi:hypothetical protein